MYYLLFHLRIFCGVAHRFSFLWRSEFRVVMSFYVSSRSEFRVVMSYYVSSRSEFRVVMSYYVSTRSEFVLWCPIMCLHVLSSVLWCPLRFPHKNDVRFVFVEGLISDLRYLCLLAHSGVQHILFCVFVAFFFVLYTYVASFSGLSFFGLPLRHSLTFIYLYMAWSWQSDNRTFYLYEFLWFSWY